MRSQLLSPLYAALLAAPLAACAAETAPADGEITDDELLDQVCAEVACGDGKSDATGPTTDERGLFTSLRRTIVDASDALKDGVFETVQDAYLDDDLVCPYPERFTHDVDLIDEETSTFTSVQELVLYTDRSPEDVLAELRGDWDWWQVPFGDASVPITEGPAVPGEPYRVDIRPLGLPLVNIEMTVPPVRPDCSRAAPGEACVEQPPLETLPHEVWDAGLEIDMGGNAFNGTFFMLARREGDIVVVREMWFHTRAVSPLVRAVLTVAETNLRPRSLPNVGVFLHLLATQGCVPFMSGTGYPGLMDRVDGQ